MICILLFRVVVVVVVLYILYYIRDIISYYTRDLTGVARVPAILADTVVVIIIANLCVVIVYIVVILYTLYDERGHACLPAVCVCTGISLVPYIIHHSGLCSVYIFVRCIIIHAVTFIESNHAIIYYILYSYYILIMY